MFQQVEVSIYLRSTKIESTENKPASSVFLKLEIFEACDEPSVIHVLIAITVSKAVHSSETHQWLMLHVSKKSVRSRAYFGHLRSQVVSHVESPMGLRKVL